jgi:hypothetical protein
MSDGPDRIHKVLLEEAVQAITEHVLQTAEAVGIDAETVGLEFQFGLEVERGKVVPVVFIDGLPSGRPLHKISFSLSAASKEIARPDTSSELAMIMDHPPPREARAAQTTGGEPPKSPGDGKIVDSPRPREQHAVQVTISDSQKPAVEGKAQSQAPRVRQEVQVTLSDHAKPVVESNVSPPQAKSRPPEPPQPAKAASQPPSAGGAGARGTPEQKPKAGSDASAGVEARFAMLDRISAARDDEDDEVDEATVSDNLPVRREDDQKASKGPKIVLPANPMLKLRKASEVGQGRSGGKLEEGSGPPSPKPEVAYQPPKPKDEAVAENAKLEALAAGVESRFIIFDHQKLRRRYEVSSDGGADDAGTSSGDQNPPGRTGAEE